MLTAPILRRIPLLANLSENDLALVYKLISVHKYDKGQIIFFENDPGDTLHVVQEGMVRIFRLAEDGREKTLAYFGEGEFFGEMALLDGGPRSAVAQAILPTRTLGINRRDFTNLLENNPRISREIIKVLSQRLRQTNAQLMNVVFRDARGRVLSTLYDLGLRYGSPVNNSTRIDLKLTHQELANLVGTARETISRVLAELQDEGLVQVEGRRLILVDMEKLQESCDT